MEGRWFDSGDSPSAEDYLRNGVVSSGVHVVLVHVFFLLGLSITNQTVHLLDNDPLIISSAATILRLQDDLGTAKVCLSTLLNYINIHFHQYLPNQKL